MHRNAELLRFSPLFLYILGVDWKSSGSLVLPCQNEEASVAWLVQAASRHFSTIVVVDDGSTDATADQAAAAGARVISTPRNLGKGAALKLGMQALSQQGCTFALMMDGDGQHRPEDIPAFLQCAEATGADLVVGNRMPHAEVMPWLRRLANRWMSRRISRRAGKELPDTQCGFRLVNLKAWHALQLETDHFEIESEMMLAFVQAGYKVEFVPIQVVGRAPHSHIHLLRDSWRWWRWWRKGG